MILDVMLPKMNGFEILRQLRAEGCTTPIILLSARGAEMDKVMGLELGAEDYVTKPFSLAELLARVKAQLRRDAIARPGGRAMTAGDLEINVETREVESCRASRRADRHRVRVAPVPGRSERARALARADPEASVGPGPPRNAAHHRQLHAPAPDQARSRPRASRGTSHGARRGLSFRQLSHLQACRSEAEARPDAGFS